MRHCSSTISEPRSHLLLGESIVCRFPVVLETRMRVCWGVRSRVSSVTSRINGGCGVGGAGAKVAVRNSESSVRRVSVSSNSI